ncbi:MAG TPA: hypothetical protein GXX63_05740 [Tissierellia bacterium]|nr:hypothetical protein [Tissierellia bacterium]
MKETIDIFAKLECILRRLKCIRNKKSIESLGVMFESDDLLYYYDTGTGKVINVDYYINKIIKRLFTYEDNVDSFIKYMKDEGISNENLGLATPF